MRKKLACARIAIVTSAAFYQPDQPSFDERIKGGDYSYRKIARGTTLSALQIGHRSESFDHSGIERDKNVALPLDRLRELEQGKQIGDIAATHYSIMGSITAPARLMKTTAPLIVKQLHQQQVDAVLLTPV